MAQHAIHEVKIMKITTYINGKLLKKALRETGAQSQREVIEEGLRNLLADVARKRFVKEFDSLRLDLTLKDLKQQRA
jgi:hypothetical protein